MKLDVSIDSKLVNVHLGDPTPAIAVMILNMILDAKNGSELVLGMRKIKEEIPGYDHFFIHGFGRNHMWVKQRVLQKENYNWITVYF